MKINLLSFSFPCYNMYMKNRKTTKTFSRLTDIRNRISGENKSLLDLTDIRNRISGEGLNKNSLDLTDIRNRISGENKSALELTDIRNRISGERLNFEENKND